MVNATYYLRFILFYYGKQITCIRSIFLDPLSHLARAAPECAFRASPTATTSISTRPLLPGLLPRTRNTRPLRPQRLNSTLASPLLAPQTLPTDSDSSNLSIPVEIGRILVAPSPNSPAASSGKWLPSRSLSLSPFSQGLESVGGGGRREILLFVLQVAQALHSQATLLHIISCHSLSEGRRLIFLQQLPNISRLGYGRV